MTLRIYMDRMPTDILECIAAKLRVQDLVSFGGVSRDARRVYKEQILRRGWTHTNWKPTHHMVCAYCRHRRATIGRLTGTRECKTCRAHPDRRFVCKTTATKILKIRDLDEIPCITCYNPNRGKYPMRLYRLFDLRRVPDPVLM